MPGLVDYEKKEKGKRGFEMPMKEYGKGKSPFLAGEADTGLTNLAHAAAMANKPGDWSASLDKAADAVGSISEAKGKMFETAIEGATKIANKAILAKKKKKLKEKGMDEEAAKLTTGGDKYGSIVEETPKKKKDDDDKNVST